MYDPTGTLREFKERLSQELQRREQWVVRPMKSSVLQVGLGLTRRIVPRVFGVKRMDTDTQTRVVAWDGWPSDEPYVVASTGTWHLPFNGQVGTWLAECFATTLNPTTRQYEPFPGTTDALGLVVRQPAEELLLVPLRWTRLVETVGDEAAALSESQLEEHLWEWLGR